jgi:trk system potassium uptake protein TrkA
VEGGTLVEIILCGAGQVGRTAAELLAAEGHSVTVVDYNVDATRRVSDTMDVRTLVGNSAQASVLEEAGVADADMLVAATQNDEINLLTAALAHRMGARRSVARVHQAAFYQTERHDYARMLGIDHLICPEYSAAQAIGRAIRNPAAMAVEQFAHGHVQMQEFTALKGAGGTLAELGLPQGVRVCVIFRGAEAIVPSASAEIRAGDRVVLAGNSESFQKARKLFGSDRAARGIVVMGTSSTARWLGRALRDRAFSVRVFESDRERAEDIAERFEWMTVLNADPTDPRTFEEEHIADADWFIAATDSDEHNIISAAWARSQGVARVACVVQSPSYLQLIRHVGIDHAFSPRKSAVDEIVGLLDRRQVRTVSSLAPGVLDIYVANLDGLCPFLDTPLKDVKALPGWIVAGVQRSDGGDDPDASFVPTATDRLQAGDSMLIIGPSGSEGVLAEAIGAREDRRP